MPDFHLTWASREVTLTEPDEVMQLLLDLDAEFVRDRRNVLVGIDCAGASLDVGLGGVHAALMVTTPEDPGYVTQGTSTSDEEVMFEFDGEETPFPVSTLVDRDRLLAATREFLETEARPTSLEWQEF